MYNILYVALGFWVLYQILTLVRFVKEKKTLGRMAALVANIGFGASLLYWAFWFTNEVIEVVEFLISALQRVGVHV